jgi:hypothetical protein
MKKFLVLFTCAENSQNHQAWKLLDQQTQDERIKNGMLAKERWEEKYKDQIVLESHSLGKITKRVDPRGTHDIPSLMGAFTVIQAISHEEAANMFLEHPHFAIFPGDGVEIIEQLSAP